MTSPLPTGLNFGWRCYEGNATYNTTGCPAVGTLTMPVAQYSHDDGCSITGGYFYTGANYPNFSNKYFFADYCRNKIGILDASANITRSITLSGNFSAFGEDSNGELYIAGASNGIISEIIDTSLGVNGFNKLGFSIYPNPTKSEIFVEAQSLEFPASIRIYDLTGKLVLTEKLENKLKNNINTSALKTGVYLVDLKDNTGIRYNSKLSIN